MSFETLEAWTTRSALCYPFYLSVRVPQDLQNNLSITLSPPSNASASVLSTSALSFLNAVSILALDSGSRDTVLFAEYDPVSRPVSPPRNKPPAEKKKYVAMSPSVVGRSMGVMSGMGSVCHAGTSSVHAPSSSTNHSYTGSRDGVPTSSRVSTRKGGMWWEPRGDKDKQPTNPATSKLHMRRLLFGAEGVEHARSVPPHSICHEQTQT